MATVISREKLPAEAPKHEFVSCVYKILKDPDVLKCIEANPLKPQEVGKLLFGLLGQKGEYKRDRFSSIWTACGLVAAPVQGQGGAFRVLKRKY